LTLPPLKGVGVSIDAQKVFGLARMLEGLLNPPGQDSSGG
jgi:hypothetical protein